VNNERIAKVNELIKDQVSIELLDIFPDQIICVTCVKTSPDLSHAKIWVSILENADKVVEQLNQKAKFIQKELSKKLVLRKVPSIHFVIDQTGQEGDKIDKIINELKQNKQF
jgi:ribosome-binding factor A